MDGQINPGETITMDIRVQNIVDALVEDIQLTLSSESNYITFQEEIVKNEYTHARSM